MNWFCLTLARPGTHIGAVIQFRLKSIKYYKSGSLLPRYTGLLMRRAVFIWLFPALLLQAQSTDSLNEYLNAVARTAATFAATAPGLMAEETLDQRGRRGFVEILRGKKDKIKNLDIRLPREFRSHQVVSSYLLAETGDGHVLHEIRTIITMDGHSLTKGGDAHHAMTIGLQSADDRTKRELLENLEQDQLEGAVTDFGQLILLFTKRFQKDYAFSLAGEQQLGEEPVVIIRYRQTSGDQGLTFFKERTEDRQSVTGDIWLRQKDFLPVRITMNTAEAMSRKFTIQTEATVDYVPSRFGLVPEHVNHKQFLKSGPPDCSLMVENDLRYADFHHARPMIP
jgi:hypothetical protein